jgi:3-methyladenine DNA glycosylase Tag
MPIPEQIDAESLGDYLEVMTRAIFQAGVSWAMVDKKWPAFRKAFCNFDAKKIAAFKDSDIERLSQDASILRSPKKIAATVENARVLIATDKEFGGFKNYLRSKNYKELNKDIHKRFKYMGELNVYYFLFRVKESVPDFEEWVVTIEGEHPRMREMVELVTKRSL